jgi:farnesyl diphosphate synthase
LVSSTTPDLLPPPEQPARRASLAGLLSLLGPGKDAAKGKANFVTLLGLEPARERVQMLADQARAHLAPFGHRAKFLKDSVDFVLDRRS